MFRLTVKEIASKKRRLVSTALAVVVGVAFIAGTLILTDTVMKTFDGVLADANAHTDAYARGTSPLKLGFGEGRNRIDASLVDTLQHAPGVDRAAARVTGYAQILDKKHKAVGGGRDVIGMNWSPVEDLNPFRLAKGHAPRGPSEIVIDQHSADAAGFEPGDRTTVLTQSAPRPVTIVGTARFGSAGSPGGIPVVLFDDATAQALLAKPGRVDGVAFVARPGVSQATLVANLKPRVGDQIEVITGSQLTKQDQADIHKNLTSISTFMLVFAGIAMFVGAFIIHNTFSIIVTQRTKETAVLRAIGASGRQVRRAILLEATVVGLLASAVGLLAGIGVAKLLEILLGAVGLDIPGASPVVQTSTIVISMTVGLVVTLVSAILPARRASKVPPIAALREVALDRSASSVRRTTAGVVISGLGAAALAGGVSQESVSMVGLGSVALFIGVAVLGPVLARPAAFVLGYPLAKLRGTQGALAQQNAMRNPNRTARTSASLMIGVALVTVIAIFAATTKASVAGSLAKEYHGTNVVESGASDGRSGISPGFARKARTAPGVRFVAEERLTRAEVDGTPQPAFAAFDTATIGRLFDFGTVEGDITKLGTNGIAVKASDGAANRPHLGDTRKVTFVTGTKTFVVRAIYDHGSDWVGSQFVGLDAFAHNVPTQLDARVFVATDDVAALEKVAAPYPTADVMNTTEFLKAHNARIDMMLKLVYALLALAVLIALLGIANTLALSIHERRRELGLLRAVGMSRGQVRSSVRWESLIIALFGAAVGVGLGVLFGSVMMRTLADDGVHTLTVPVGQLAVITALAAVAGIAAGLLPARRAARIDVLKAVSAT